MARKRKEPPPELLEQHPCLAMEAEAFHPSTSPCHGTPPRAFTAAVHNSIVSEIRKGNRPVVAASLAGIGQGAFYEWCRRGREDDPHFAQFVADIDQALAEAEATALGVITSSFTDPETRNSDDAKWYLERSRAFAYAKQVRTAVDSQLAEFINLMETSLPPAIFAQVLSVYMGFAQTYESKQLQAPLVVDGETEE